jgi:uncharacterized membrane protein YcaP (DUF421 family)
MFDWSWISSSASTLLMVAVSSLGIYLALLLLTRLAGLRSFAKMSSFDFAITVAFGSLLASVIVTPDPSLVTGAGAMASLFAIQYVVSKSRRLASAVEHVVDNEALLLMAGPDVIQEHLDKSRITVDDIRSKLRLAGVSHLDQVYAVVFESTGDVSVIKASDDVDPWLFTDVRGCEHLGMDSHPPHPAGSEALKQSR